MQSRFAAPGTIVRAPTLSWALYNEPWTMYASWKALDFKEPTLVIVVAASNRNGGKIHSLPPPHDGYYVKVLTPRMGIAWVWVPMKIHFSDDGFFTWNM